MREPGKFRFGVGLALLVLVLDQATKWWVLEVAALDRVGQIVVTPFFNLTMVWNRGVTFGLLGSDLWFKPLLLGGLALVIAALLLRWLARAESWRIAWGLGLVLGGAVGNVIDRARFGAVVDFVHLHVAGYHWYVFNLADSAIVCGVGLLLLDALIRPSAAAK
ncbi:MAG: signal peptidase II [Acetobacteraceae bacterium]|nr:signal peptidase II [Acetobacteraceae bacterium]